MLPPEREEQVEEPIQNAANRSDENRERIQHEIVGPLNTLIDHFVSYKNQQKAAEKGKRRREITTIWGIFITAGVALITAVIFACQLHEMEKVYPPIRDQANAAIAAAKASRDNFIVDQRPYVRLTNHLETPNLVPGTSQIAWNWEITNYGKTPARRIRFFTYMKIDSGEFKPTYRRFNRGDPVIASALPPSKTTFATVVSDPGITPAEFTRLNGIDVAIAILVKIEYLGVSDERYESTFCLAHLANGEIGYLIQPDRCENDIK
jgi:hypothetical protein